MNSSVSFIDLKESDLPKVKEIYDYYILNSTATFHTDPIQIEELKEFIFINHPIYKSYMIKCDEEIIGYCYLTYFKKRQAYNRTAEVTIYLSHTSHKKGIGFIALNHLENIAKEKGIKNLLGIIAGDNEASIKLFEKCSYFKCSHFKNVGEKFGKILDVVAYQKEI